jgi:hypothetical protein
MTTRTVANTIAEARYDLRDQGKQKWDDTYLLLMHNRGLRILDRELINIGSDLVVRSDSVTTGTSVNYAEVDDTVDSIHRAYIDQQELEKIPLRILYRYRQEVIGSDDGQPQIFGTFGRLVAFGTSKRTIEFDYLTNEAYTIDFIYNHRHEDLALTDNTPYSGVFDDYLREGIISLAQKAKDDKVVQVDNFWRLQFREILLQHSTAVNLMPRYAIDPYHGANYYKRR